MEDEVDRHIELEDLQGSRKLDQKERNIEGGDVQLGSRRREVILKVLVLLEVSSI